MKAWRLCGVSILLLIAVMVTGCGPTLKERYPANTGRPILVTNIVNGVTNIAPFDIGGLTK
ncbi:MAG: hypothetical protein NTY53_17045 [Kiritimatiellaeota bacterium]|nr:hypothetical protein [Kiritimatiellota bacterium]